MSKNSLQGQARWMHSGNRNRNQNRNWNRHRHRNPLLTYVFVFFFIFVCLRFVLALFLLCFFFPFLFQFTQFSFLCSFWGGNCCNALKSFIKTTKWNWVPEPEPERMFSGTSRLGLLGCKSIWPLAAALDWSEDTHTHRESSFPPLRQHICSFIYVLTA